MEWNAMDTMSQHEVATEENQHAPILGAAKVLSQSATAACKSHNLAEHPYSCLSWALLFTWLPQLDRTSQPKINDPAGLGCLSSQPVSIRSASVCLNLLCLSVSLLCPSLCLSLLCPCQAVPSVQPGVTASTYAPQTRRLEVANLKWLPRYLRCP